MTFDTSPRRTLRFEPPPLRRPGGRRAPRLWLALLLGFLRSRLIQAITKATPRFANLQQPRAATSPVRLLAAVVVMLLPPMAAGAWASEKGVIAGSSVNLRSGPGTEHDAVAQLPKGTRVVILGRETGWLKIETDGRSGYIRDLPELVKSTARPEPSDRNDPTDQKLKQWQRKADDIQEKMTVSQSGLKAIAEQEKRILSEFEAGEQALDQVRRQVHAAETELSKLHAEVTETEQRLAQMQNDINIQSDHASKRLVALYKLEHIGRLQLLAAADSFFDFITRKSALERILAQDEALLQKLSQDRTAYDRMLDQLKARKAQEQSLQAALTRHLAGLKEEQEKRGTRLSRIRGEKELGRAALESLRKDALELDHAIQALAAEAARQARLEAERREQTLAARKAGQPASRKAGQTPSSTSPNERNASATVDESEGISEEQAFEAHKGLLSWPVKGKIISYFGTYQDERYNVTNFQSGIDIKAERGEPIRAAGAGTTIFSSWFNGFGNMIILDHGNHFYTVYAHLEEVFKVKGDRVEKDDVIATVGDSGSLNGPALHFEVRHHGKPLDPLRWIKNG